MEKPAILGGEPVRKRLLIFGEPIIEVDEIEEVIKTLKSGWIGMGPKVREFEELSKTYLNAKYVVALSSCSAALHTSMIALGIENGDEVITTPMTFCATGNSIVHSGAKPVFVDIDKNTLNIDTKKIEQAITNKTKAILPVHFAGRPCDLDSIKEIAKRNKLLIIEDAAHAFGAEYKGKKIGDFGEAICFSFYANKNITTIEGGLVSVLNKDIADRIKILRLQGLNEDIGNNLLNEPKNFIEEPGFKYNMTDIQASIGIKQLSKIDKWYEKRIKIWELYNQAFKDLPIQVPLEEEKDTKHSRHLYTIILDSDKLSKDRDFIIRALKEEGISARIHYIPLHLHPYYQKLGYRKGDFPNAEYVGERIMSLPLSAKLTENDVKDVISAIKKVLNYFKI